MTSPPAPLLKEKGAPLQVFGLFSGEIGRKEAQIMTCLPRLARQARINAERWCVGDGGNPKRASNASERIKTKRQTTSSIARLFRVSLYYLFGFFV